MLHLCLILFVFVFGHVRSQLPSLKLLSYLWNTGTSLSDSMTQVHSIILLCLTIIVLVTFSSVGLIENVESRSTELKNTVVNMANKENRQHSTETAMREVSVGIWHPTSAETCMWGTMTGCHAGYQEVSRCHTRGES